MEKSLHYTCSKSNTQNNYDNIVEVEGTGIDSGIEVDDDDDTEVKVNVVVYDLALRKQISDDIPCMLLGLCPDFPRGEDITFSITVVFHMANLDAVAEIVDYIPE